MGQAGCDDVERRRDYVRARDLQARKLTVADLYTRQGAASQLPIKGVRSASNLLANAIGSPVEIGDKPHEPERSRSHSARRYASKSRNTDREMNIERKWKRNGEYKEERKCKGGYGW